MVQPLQPIYQPINRPSAHLDELGVEQAAQRNPDLGAAINGVQRVLAHAAGRGRDGGRQISAGWEGGQQGWEWLPGPPPCWRRNFALTGG